MVRTYGNQQKDYHLVSPWEQAMQNADQANGVPIQTGKRMFNKNNVSRTSYNHHNVAPQQLPPLKDEPNSVLRQHENEIGNILTRSPDRLTNITKEFQLYDASDTGCISKNAIIEILKRYKVPKNEKSQKNIICCFVKPDNPSQIDRHRLLEYLEDCRDTFAERKANGSDHVQEVRQITVEIPKRKNLADSTHGRYDSESTTQAVSNKKGNFGRGSKDMFVEKRDAGLILEIERAFKASHISDPHSLIDDLAEKLDRTCRNDENMSDNMHVKSLVDKSQFPLNSALTLKCIDRLDVQDIGRIEWPKFIEFLRRGAASFPRSESQTPDYSPNMNSATPNVFYKKLPSKHYPPNKRASSPTPTPDAIPEKPAWEARTPLQNIKPQKSRSKRMKKEKDVDDEPSFEPQETSTNRKPQKLPDETFVVEDTAPPSTASELNDTSIQMMDDDIEDAFVKYASQLRNEPHYNDNRYGGSYDSGYSNGLSGMSDNDIPHGLDFNVMGERGESFKRVTDALIDKGRRTNDIITILDVERIINYYNLLFETNIPMDQVQNVMNKYSSDGRIDVRRLVGTFGTEIV